MSAKLDGDDVNSGGAVREEIKEVSRGTIGGSKCKTFMGNTSYPGQVGKGTSNHGVRVLEEFKVFVGEEQSKGVNSKIELGGGDLVRGSILTNKFDEPKLRVVEMMAHDDERGSMGVMNLVEKVLGGSFSNGNDGEDLNNLKKNADIDIVANWNTRQGVIRESIFESVINEDETNWHTDSPCERTGPIGEQHLAIIELVPDSKLENARVNDVNAGTMISKERGEEHITENEGEYNVSDLVWGKVKSHPWWPGQIFAPSAASDKAKLHFKKDGYLIAYFGDQTFAWNEVSKIKPFRGHFFLMEKQSKAEGFCHAVDCALDEFARRVELGLSCSCLPKEVQDKINSQVVENAGIQEESSIRYGGDSISTALLFFPDDLLQFIKHFAEAPRFETDRLNFVLTKAQVLAFNRWKGLYQLPKFEQHYLLLEDDAQLNLEQRLRNSQGVSEGVFLNTKYAIKVPSKERKLTTQDFSSRNPKRISSVSNFKRQKSLTSLGPGDYMSSQPMARPGVGEHINRGLDSGDASVGEMATSNVRKSRRKPVALAEFPPDEILSRLSLAALSPMQGRYILTSIIGFLCQIRSSMCVENSRVRNENKRAGKQPISWKTTDTLRCDSTEDSYHTQEQVVFEPKNPAEKDVAAAELEASTGMKMNLGDQNEPHVILDPETENPSIQMKEMPEECFPTALILNFKNLESIPSIANLHEICRLYGHLNELKTELFSKSKHAKVVFKRKVDAESIFSHIREHNLFGSSLVSFRLHVLPIKSHATSKRKRKIHS